MPLPGTPALLQKGTVPDRRVMSAGSACTRTCMAAESDFCISKGRERTREQP